MLLNIIPFFYTVLTYLQISIIENLKIENFWECFPGLKKCNKIDLQWSICIVSTTSVFKILLFVYISISAIIVFINSWLMEWFSIWEIYVQMTNKQSQIIYTFQFSRIHIRFLIIIEKVSSRPIAKFYNRNDINVVEAELRLIKTRLTSFHKKHNVKNRNVCMAY